MSAARSAYEALRGYISRFLKENDEIIDTIGKIGAAIAAVILALKIIWAVAAFFFGL